MRWAFRIATVSGIPIRVHVTFVLFLVGIYVWKVAHGQGVSLALEAVGLLASAFLCIVLHELGHALMAQRFGVRTRDITLLPIGGVARLERIPEKPSQEVAVALMGPAVNVLIAIALVPVGISGGGFEAIAREARTASGFFTELLVINVFLAVFNLIPAFPMDGGRVLRAILASRLDYVHATRIAANVGQGIAFLFGLLGLIWNPILLFIALFVFVGAGQEAAAVQMRSAFEGVPVSDAMIRDFKTLRADEPLSRAVELLLAGHQHDFPVVGSGSGAQPVGVLTRSDLMAALAGGRQDRRVEEVARADCGVAHPRELLEAVFLRMQERSCPAVPVVDRDGTVVGMVTLENVGELAMVHAALRRVSPWQSPPRTDRNR